MTSDRSGSTRRNRSFIKRRLDISKLSIKSKTDIGTLAAIAMPVHGDTNATTIEATVIIIIRTRILCWASK